MKNIWLITVGEPLPIGRATSRNRMLRTGILANTLASRGHCVTWWTSTFDHTHKKHYFDKTVRITSELGYQIVLLHGMPYSKNVSLRRIVNHYQVAKDFERLSRQEIKPDVIFCSYPTIELSLAAVNFGERHNLPVVIDVRDIWPDIFLDIFPCAFRWLGRLILSPYFYMSQKIFHKCTAITAVSDGYLKWGLSSGNRRKRALDKVFALGFQKPTDNYSDSIDAYTHFSEMGIDESKFICWFSGTFGRTYDLLPVIAAAKELINRPVQFVFSGSGEQEALWRRKATGLSNVIFTGWLDSKQINSLAKIADIGLMAYAKGAPQSLPNKIFEYLSAGLPIVSCLEGETATFLETNVCGISYCPNDCVSLINSLCKLFDDEKLFKTLGENAFKLFKSQYSAEDIYSRLSAYLEHF